MNLFKKVKYFPAKIDFESFITFIYFHVYVRVYVYVWKYMSYSSYIEVKRQLVEAGTTWVAEMELGSSSWSLPTSSVLDLTLKC